MYAFDRASMSGTTQNLMRSFLLILSMALGGSGQLSAAQNLNFSPFISVAPGAHLSFVQSSTLQLQSDFFCHGTMILSDGCIIDGQGFVFDLQDGGIQVMPGAHVVLRNLTLKNAVGAALVCQDDAAVVELDNVTWLLEDDVTFGAGALRVKNNFIISGPAQFTYSSTATSTILANSQLVLENSVTFSCATSIAGPLACTDHTSFIVLDQATLYASATSLQLTSGTLQIKNNSFLAADPLGKGIRLGSGVTGEDMVCRIFAGVVLQVMQGNFVYNNTNSASWVTDSTTSIFSMNDATKLVLLQPLYLGQGLLRTADGVTLATEPGTFIEGSIQPLGTLYHSDTTGLRRINFEKEDGVLHTWHKKLGDTAQNGTYRVRIGVVHG